MDYIGKGEEYYNFETIGREIKAERERRGWTREKAAVLLDISESYLKAIENHGAAPGFQLFYRIMSLFCISVDKYFFGDKNVEISGDESLYLQANNMLCERESSELYVLISTMEGMERAKKFRGVNCVGKCRA
jgi:transcriptional regulator with XRE-family HTH domain